MFAFLQSAKPLLLSAAVLLFGAACGAAEARRFLAITADEAERRLRSGERIAIVDVRDELERDVDGRIPNDISVPLAPKDQFGARVQQALPDRNITVFCYCKRGIVGGLSDQAATIMAGLGYPRAYYISGGFDGWPYQKIR